MRINLNCPYAEKDQAKALGARWDSMQKTWYIENVEVLDPFMRWIKSETPPYSPAEKITLAQYLDAEYKTHKSLSFRAAKAFGVPYPLESGWVKKYTHRVITTAQLEALTKGGKKAAKKHNQAVATPPATTPRTMVAHCGCYHVLPWEDCEHTMEKFEQEADAAYREMIGETGAAIH